MAMNISNSTQIRQQDLFLQSSVLLPAVMTLVCFICTVMSITVAGFICLRDREAKDENEIIIKQQREDEFVSKAVSLFYNIRTFSVFRVNDIIEDKNESKPAWLTSKEEVIKSLQLYGICLTDSEDKQLSSLSNIFEVDTEALLYLELERFAKAIAAYGEETMRYFPSIAQDGVVFRTQFIEEKKEIYEGQLIYTLFREMRQITDLFVLLLTGIDAGFLSNNKLPQQFKMCLMAEELCCLEDFFYNYYQRLYSHRSFRPSSDILQSMHVENLQRKQNMISAASQDHHHFEDDPFDEIEHQKESKATLQGSVMSKVRQTYQAVKAAQRMAARKRKASTARPMTPTENKPTQEQQSEEIQHANSEPSISEIGVIEEETTELKTTPSTSSYVQYRQQKSDIQTEKPKILELETPKPVPKLIKSPWSMRRRGKLKSKVVLEKNPFTYMVFKVLECLKGNALQEGNYEKKQYNQVDRNFVI